MRPRHHRLWLVSLESLASLVWVVALVATLVVVAIDLALGIPFGIFGLGLAWGIATSVIATVQLTVAVRLKLTYDLGVLRSFILGPLFPLLYWTISAAAALREQTVALVRGPGARPAVWDIPRQRIGAGAGSR